MTEVTDLPDALGALLEQGKPRRLLAVGGLAQKLLAPYAQASAAELATLDPSAAAAPAEPPYDLALVADGLDRLDAAQASVLLGRLRDLYARRIWVVLREGAAGLAHHDLMGHGFSRAGRYQLAGAAVSLYEFDIGTYKTTPDWLNSRNWANPQLFDKYRW